MESWISVTISPRCPTTQREQIAMYHLPSVCVPVAPFYRLYSSSENEFTANESWQVRIRAFQATSSRCWSCCERGGKHILTADWQHPADPGQRMTRIVKTPYRSPWPASHYCAVGSPRMELLLVATSKSRALMMRTKLSTSGGLRVESFHGPQDEQEQNFSCGLQSDPADRTRAVGTS